MVHKMVLYIFLFVMTLSAQANELKLGLGAGLLSYPTYVGAKKQEVFVVPFPYVKYVSKHFTIDREKIYSEFYSKKKTALEISVMGIPASYSEDTAREGMPDLDMMAEFGLKYTYTLYEYKSQQIYLDVPFRASFSLGRDDFFKYRGYRMGVDLNYQSTIFYGIEMTLSTAVIFSDERLHNYYYGVAEEYATKEREVYDSHSGYSHLYNQLFFTKSGEDYWFMTFVRHFYLGGSAVENSPLIETKNSFMFGMVFSYLFYNYE